MKLNLKKTKVMPFNFTRKYDFVPSFTLEDTNLEVVYTTKLVGLTLTNECRSEYLKYCPERQLKTLVFAKT